MLYGYVRFENVFTDSRMFRKKLATSNIVICTNPNGFNIGSSHKNGPWGPRAGRKPPAALIAKQKINQ